MKILSKNIFVFAGLILMVACTDLQEEPVGLLAPDVYFRSKSDVEAAIFSGYARISSEPMYGRQFNGALQLRSDMVNIGDRGTPAERQQVNDFNMDANNGMVSRWWPQFYLIISAENAAIDGANKVSMTDLERDQLIAEARFIRGWTYFHLVQLFGDIPVLLESVTDPGSVKSLEKTPADEVYQIIIEDLSFAKDNLPDKQPGDVRSRPSKGAAGAFLASVYLTMGDFSNAATEAKWVITNKSLFNYGLAPDYQDLFNADKVDGLNEPIFVIDYISQYAGPGNSNNDVMGTMTNYTIPGSSVYTLGWNVLVPSVEAYTSWDSRDYRRSVSFDTAVVDNGVIVPYTSFSIPRPYQAKFTRFPGASANPDKNESGHNYLLMRYAEVLLIAAEALTEVNNGPTAEAEGYLNEVRARARNWAGTPSAFPMDVSSGLTKDAFIDTIIEERRLELAFEFKRWYDIKRRQLGVEVFTGSNSLEPHANFDPTRDYLFPLPGQELNRSPNLKPQNPGY